jgi:hypothetical protein
MTTPQEIEPLLAKELSRTIRMTKHLQQWQQLTKENNPIAVPSIYQLASKQLEQQIKRCNHHIDRATYLGISFPCMEELSLAILQAKKLLPFHFNI